MRSSWRVATVFGIDVRLHVTFVLVLVLGAWPWLVWGPSGALFGAVMSLAVFACIALHELGHSLVAKAFGIPVTDITLTPIGGVAVLKDKPKTPTQEWLIAIAGPAVNVVLAGLFAGLGSWLEGLPGLVDAARSFGHEAPRAEHIWVMLVFANVTLALFNMLPALPMDGGRVLRAFLSYVFDAERATRIAAVVARVVAIGFVAAWLFADGASPMLPFIALVVYVGAGAEVREAKLTRVLAQIAAGDVVSPYAPRFEPGSTLGQAVLVLQVSPLPVFAVEQAGRFVGVVLADELLDAVRQGGPFGFVSSLLRREVPVVQASDSLDVARSKLLRGGVLAAAVVRQGRFLGLVTEVELARAMEVSDRLEAQPARPGFLERVDRS
ncbi:MAG: site-2 protease family protein [Myxococcaceae bacterium]|nr:site-2 protease family protein [Myxococcaceae bacterium]